MQNMMKDTEARMRKCIESFKIEIAKLRTGRAHPSILDQVTVNYYDREVPINQVASINVTDARTLTITPWEKPIIPAIEKAIFNSGLGLNPTTTGNLIRIPMPALNEERSKD